MTSISIVIPCYNAEATLQRTLESLEKQCDKDFEVVIVNDGSTDGSEKIVTEKQNRLNIRYIAQANQGLGASRNNGIKEATGEYVCFLDADDIWKENKVSRIRRHLMSQDGGTVEMIVHDELLVDKELKTISYLKSTVPKDWVHIVLYGNTLSPSAVCVRRELVLKEGGFKIDKNVHGAEDWDLWIRLLRKGISVLVIPEVLGYYVMHGRNMIGTSDFKRRVLNVYDSYADELLRLGMISSAEEYIARIIYRRGNLKSLWRGERLRDLDRKRKVVDVGIALGKQVWIRGCRRVNCVLQSWRYRLSDERKR